MPTRSPARPNLFRLEDRSTPAAIGSLDPAFGTAGRAILDLGGADKLTAVATLGDGRIVAAGTNGADAVVVRLLANGSLDATFGTNGKRVIDFGGTADEPTAIGIDGTGNIYLAGKTNAGAGGGNFVAVKLSSNGTPDAGFGTAGVATVDIGGKADAAYDFAPDSTGRLVLAGVSGTDFALARLKTDGTLDTTFGTGGTKTVSFGAASEARVVFVASDNTIYVAGHTALVGSGVNKDVVAVRFDADATILDAGFGNATVTVGETKFKAEVIDFGGTDTLAAATRDAAGRFLLVGTSTNGAGSNFAVARTSVAFALDAGFGTGGKQLIDFGGTDAGTAVYAQPDGRVVVVGSSTAANGKATLAAARLTEPTGALDGSFGTGGKSLIAAANSEFAFATAQSNTGAVVVAGASGSDAAVFRLAGTVGLPGLVVATGPTAGHAKQYTLADGKYIDGSSFNTFPGTTALARTAVADVTGDGVEDIIVAAGPGIGPMLLVYDGATGALLANQMAFEAAFHGGLYVAAGDFNKDGRADIVVSPDVGGGPRVRVLDGANLAGNKLVALADFFAIEDANFRGGVRPAVGDLDADGSPEIIVSAGVGGGPRIAIWKGSTIQTGTAPNRLVPDFFAFEPGLRDGAFVAAGDVDGDGIADLAFGGGPNGGPRVLIANGAKLLSDGVASFTAVANFFAGDPNTRGGIRLALRDVDGDAKADLVTGSGDGLRSEIRVYKGTTLLANAAPTADQTFDPFGAALPAGVFVG